MSHTKISTKEKIKLTALRLFNNQDTLSITTNHIAKEAGISPGNLYYHYKNKEEIIRSLYQDMHAIFESNDFVSKLLLSKNPLKELSALFDIYGKFFWEYRFLMRDAAVLIALDSELKKIFAANQEIRIIQIEAVIKFFISEKIFIPISKENITLMAQSIWFTSGYWLIFQSTRGGITIESIRNSKEAVFKLSIRPFLTKKGKNLYEAI